MKIPHIILPSLAIFTPLVLAQAHFPPETSFRAGELTVNGSSVWCETTGGVFGFLQSNGDVVIDLDADGNTLWSASSIGGKVISGFPEQQCGVGGACQLIFQNDGNFVSYFNGIGLWSTGTEGRGEWLVCQESAPWLYIVDGDGIVLWSTNTAT